MILLTTLAITLSSTLGSSDPSVASAAAMVDGTSSNVAPIPRMRPSRAFENVKFKRPVQILARPDQPERLYVLEQPGRIVVLDRTTPDMDTPEVFLDIRPEVRMKNNEEGLLSMAFSPDVATDGSAVHSCAENAVDGFVTRVIRRSRSRSSRAKSASRRTSPPPEAGRGRHTKRWPRLAPSSATILRF